MKTFCLIQLFFLPFLSGAQKLNGDSMLISQNKILAEAVNRPYHDFSIKSNKGIIASNDFKGKVVVINFWHNACAPCIGEMAALNELYDSFSVNENFKFFSFTFNAGNKVEAAVKKYNIKFPVYSINGDTCDRLMYNLAYPLSIVLNDSGIVKYIQPGASLNPQENIKYFQKKLFPIIREELLKVRQ